LTTRARVPGDRVENAAASTASLQTKVPEVITIYFWAVKILSTGMGEATSDFLAHWINPFLAATIGGVGLVVALLLQLGLRRYIAWSYWLAVAMVSVFGTMAADGLHFELGIPYYASAAFYLVILVIIFVVWHASEKTLSIHSIFTRRRELFYWGAVLATFALGTAVGDLSGYTLQLGFFASALIFSALFAVVAVSYRLLRFSPVLAFWAAYVLTRPIGASFADWMGVPNSSGGLNWGRGAVALCLAVPMVLLVAYLAISRKDTRTVASP
jgi:uncharacterized membrane-anchored protein